MNPNLFSRVDPEEANICLADAARICSCVMSRRHLSESSDRRLPHLSKEPEW